MEEWERKRSVGRFRHLYRRRSRRTMQNIMNFLWSKYFSFTVLGCTRDKKKSSISDQIDLEESCMSVGLDLPGETTNVSLKPTRITEENQTCLRTTQRLPSQYRCDFVCLATSYKRGTFCTTERRELGRCFATCLLHVCSEGP